MKDYGYWFYEELINLVGVRPGRHHYGDRKDSYIILNTPNHGPQLVKVSSNRMELFKANPKCVSCDRVGVLWILQSHNGERPHLNLYHVGESLPLGDKYSKIAKNGLVMMTKDHILPRSRGGSNRLDNYQTMCEICNSKKGDLILGDVKPTPFPRPLSFKDIMEAQGFFKD